MSLCTYSPQISPGNSNITPPPLTGPLFIKSSTVTFTYPYDSPTSTLTLRAPTTSDKETIRTNRVHRLTRGGTLIVYNSINWPKNRILNFNIEALTSDEILSLQDFVKLSLGKEIGYLDYESQQWRGLILNPDTIIKDNSRSCNYSAEFTFRGEIV